MTDEDIAQATWLPVIGKALAYLCLQEAQKREPGKFDTVLKRVKFLQGLGLSQADAAHAAGSSAASVQVLHSQAKSKKGGKNGGTKRKTRRR
jgi:hypothetical protein